jgi:hypothetical protein
MSGYDFCVTVFLSITVTQSGFRGCDQPYPTMIKVRYIRVEKHFLFGDPGLPKKALFGGKARLPIPEPWP